jgi:dTDP-4-dehydrorhamnose reductase
MQKVLITGANGLLGSELVQYRHGDFGVVGLTHDSFDVTDPASIRAALETHQPHVVINCAVVVSVDKCENDPTLCFGVNRDGVKNILEAILQTGRPVTFVQISSSEVFGRVQEGEYAIHGYAEDDTPMPVSNYQKSKAEAEAIVQEFAAAHPGILTNWYIVRAGWLYGGGPASAQGSGVARRKTFVEQFLDKLQQEETLEVIANQWRSPTWTRHFAQGLFEILDSERTSGIYHIANEAHPGEASTLDVVEELAHHLGLDRVRAPLKLVSRDAIFKIPRAPSNVLKNTKLPKLPHWREALQEYLESIRIK